MEFWGIEVKAGQPIKSDPGADYVIHLSQASLGEAKNKAESVPLYVNADGKKLVLGTLSHQNCPQLSFDLVFDQEFELSHNWKNGSVFFLGYKTYIPEEGDDFDISSEESSDEEEIPLVAAENGKSKTDAKTDVKTAKTDARKPEAVKQAVKIAEPSKKTAEPSKKTEDDDDSEDESDSDDSDDSEDEDEPDEMSMDESSDEEDEETPKKVESSKNRPVETATPASKKAKSAVSPQKSDGKKGGHTATPHPGKQAGKNSAKTPKSGGLGSHKKAKHGGK
ncbi:histone deacetylase HDT1-like isoform X2 [Hibiscus syriacus]|uniref:histone deacetylase HDT1-like isoform X2 n=1 Tax=Hibiscus syriacus TaxID=106335 RepID=UPI001921A9EA|nr:histone deacetylase HDT1-like isoform X2 [Hibiscus syriacus]